MRVLNRQGYRGYLGLDLGGGPSLKEDLMRSAGLLKRIAAEQNVELHM